VVIYFINFVRCNSLQWNKEILQHPKYIQHTITRMSLWRASSNAFSYLVTSYTANFNIHILTCLATRYSCSVIVNIHTVSSSSYIFVYIFMGVHFEFWCKFVTRTPLQWPLTCSLNLVTWPWLFLLVFEQILAEIISAHWRHWKQTAENPRLLEKFQNGIQDSKKYKLWWTFTPSL